MCMYMAANREALGTFQTRCMRDVVPLHLRQALDIMGMAEGNLASIIVCSIGT